LSHRFERSPNKKGKEFVKFVDGLANVAGKYAPDATATQLVVPALVDPYDLLAKAFLPCDSRRNASGIRSIPQVDSSSHPHWPGDLCR
jgi:hypothetical protein